MAGQNVDAGRFWYDVTRGRMDGRDKKTTLDI
jgi:hypothetical protein